MVDKLKRAYHKLKDYRYYRTSYAQEGEDLLLERIFESMKTGYYVDIGAYHPKRYSNTFLFCKKGWRGINIDARPDSMITFKKERPRDINLELGVSKKKQTLTYYMYNEPAFNGFNKRFSDSNVDEIDFKSIGKKQIETLPLHAILDDHLPSGQEISFLSVDAEGLDLEVLESNDWIKYKPIVVLVEMLNVSADAVTETEIHSFLVSQGYYFFYKSPNTVFYKDKSHRIKTL